ncbi:transporter, small conductance mechanosensitive ion channel MscS family protein [Bacteriovorax sp. BSW11_IV]|uniref:mechanosensitive ion channel family protein n=1 Tax=Bacteriovorax sp. BSW11_IV TaxID=1353529 RepID=UPI00038A4DCB|nr:mechanosensitive ion channel family protein [Bacteriovorax sp. BSW11_IV]EQC42926.1 transporter, small conductance mechanosensitive ion channel MscS family protein [Bacteriovorax sp. BSW11_IV]
MNNFVENYKLYIEGIVFLIMGFTAVSAIVKIVSRILPKKFSDTRKLIITKIIKYTLNLFVIFVALNIMGVNLKVLLGAAGILSVAIGFASQTSASNLISGLFIWSERPFKVGDSIIVGDTTGDVLSVDLLSTKLRTFDNLMIRIPNETLMKSQITNISYFDIRRVDLKIPLSFSEDLKRVEKLLNDVVDKNLLCLDEPKPLFIVQGFFDFSINIQFSFWVRKENYLKTKNKIQIDILNKFREEGINHPYPKRIIQTEEGRA